jgi:hypothetical protein
MRSTQGLPLNKLHSPPTAVFETRAWKEILAVVGGQERLAL